MTGAVTASANENCPTMPGVPSFASTTSSSHCDSAYRTLPASANPKLRPSNREPDPRPVSRMLETLAATVVEVVTVSVGPGGQPLHELHHALRVRRLRVVRQQPLRLLHV